MSASLIESAMPVSLNTFADARFLPLVLSVVENGCRALGAGKAEALKLVLSSEEIFSHLASVLPEKTPLQLGISTGIYYDQVEMSVPVGNVDLRALNLTASVSPERAGDLEDMGLLIAARSVDHLRILKNESGGITFRIIKERAYPEAEVMPDLEIPEEAREMTVTAAEPEALKAFVYSLIRHYEPEAFPGAFAYPGKLVDMMRGGTYGNLIAQNRAKGVLYGGVAWHVLNKRVVECFGPYVFVKKGRKEVTRALLDGVVGKIARTHALGLINRFPTREMPTGYFEQLGTVMDFAKTAEGRECPYYYRLLDEDLGSKVWATPEIEAFLRAAFQRLVLPREAVITHNEGEHLPAHSVIATEFEHPMKRAILRPMLLGEDKAEILNSHVAALGGEAIGNILFELDLGISSNALWIPALIRQRFAPRVLLPYAGKGDIIVFQYDATAA